mmetsp:Transcript_14934/g.24822  ORF Transcript_14934/g.24822 Transcript_14934/m.24822 type:complete len:223 (+) Transcript_14934:1386-2054(+)
MQPRIKLLEQTGGETTGTAPTAAVPAAAVQEVVVAAEAGTGGAMNTLASIGGAGITGTANGSITATTTTTTTTTGTTRADAFSNEQKGDDVNTSREMQGRHLQQQIVNTSTRSRHRTENPLTVACSATASTSSTSNKSLPKVSRARRQRYESSSRAKSPSSVVSKGFAGGPHRAPLQTPTEILQRLQINYEIESPPSLLVKEHEEAEGEVLVSVESPIMNKS